MEVEVSAIVKAGIKAQSKAKDIKQSDIEAMLFKQAAMLDLMFGSLANSATTIGNKEEYNLAFKAQDLSRKTLMALHEVRNPRKSATFIKNEIATQVNQQLVTNTDKQQNNLGESNAPQVDFRAETKAERTDPKLATLDAIHRS